MRYGEGDNGRRGSLAGKFAEGFLSDLYLERQLYVFCEGHTDYPAGDSACIDSGCGSRRTGSDYPIRPRSAAGEKTGYCTADLKCNL